MSSSYKIALLSVAVLCAVVLIYYAGWSGASQPMLSQDDGSARLVGGPGGDPGGTTAERPSPGERPSPRPGSTEADGPARPTEGQRASTPPGPTPPPTISLDGVPDRDDVPVGMRDASEAPTAPQRGPRPGEDGDGEGLPTEYVVQPGDTFRSIAVRLYGSERYWQAIAKVNPMISPTGLRPGTRIRLPSEAQLDELFDPEVPVPSDERVHVVRSGDTLSTIAERYYGDPGKWNVIYHANRQVIGPSPDRLKIGMELTIPSQPQ